MEKRRAQRTGDGTRSPSPPLASIRHRGIYLPNSQEELQRKILLVCVHVKT